MAVYTRTADVTNTNNATQIDNLASGDDYIVGREATLITTGTGSAVVRTAGNSDMAINGELISAEAVLLATGGGNDISIGATGSLTSLNGFSTIDITGSGNRIYNAGEIVGSNHAMNITGDSSRIVNDGTISSVVNEVINLNGNSNVVINHGTISGVEDDGVYISGDGGDFILNSGVISAVNDDGIQIGGAEGATNRIVNTGTISTDSFLDFAILGGSSNDLVTNRGLLIGNVDLQAGNDTFNTRFGTVQGEVRGNNGDDTMLGSAEDDTFLGGSENDTLSGFAGDDLLDGGDGNDILSGGLGSDDLVGGGGFDAASYARASGKVTVSLLDSDANTGEAAGDTFDSIENLFGSRFADVLIGSNGVNEIFGDRGADEINGGKGSDDLAGGDGNDTFVFNTALGATNIDDILDYVVADDTIELENAIFSGLAAGDLDATAFKVGAAATTATQRIVYNKTTGELFFDADGNGAGAAVKFATVAGNTNLTVNDFFVV